MPPVLSQRQTTSQSSLHDAGETSHSSSPKRLSDLEKAETAEDVQDGNNTGAYRATSSGRISRIQSLTQRRAVFDHPLSHVKTTADVLVDFDGPDDPYRPINWPFRKKVITTVLYGFTTASSFPLFSSLQLVHICRRKSSRGVDRCPTPLTTCFSFLIMNTDVEVCKMGSTWASSVYSPAIHQISEQFHVGTEVSLLGLSVLLCGFGIGPLLWAPLSEIFGRKPAVLIPYFLAAVFSFGTATAKDIQTIIITRFFAGLFGSAPVTNTGGVLGDIWAPTQRGTAIVGYAFAVVGGPVLGPIVGGAVVQSYLRWRWTEYLTGIFMLCILTLDILILDESYPSRLLVYKARRLRIKTGNWALHAEFEEWEYVFSRSIFPFLDQILCLGSFHPQNIFQGSIYPFR